VGIDFTSSTNVVLAKLTWTHIDTVQAEDRCHRYRLKNPISVFYLLLQSLTKRIYGLEHDSRILKFY